MLAKTKQKILRVAFFGDADVGPWDEAYKKAVETAALLANNGYIIVNGGGPGIMDAATEGARKAGGRAETVIIDPRYEPKNYEGSSKENLEYCQKFYKVKDINKRNWKLVNIADAFVIFKGGTGTLAEVGLVWELAKFEYGHHEPLIFVGPEWAKVVPTLEKNMNYQGIEKRVVTVVMEPEEVLRVLTLVGNYNGSRWGKVRRAAAPLFEKLRGRFHYAKFRKTSFGRK